MTRDSQVLITKATYYLAPHAPSSLTVIDSLPHPTHPRSQVAITYTLPYGIAVIKSIPRQEMVEVGVLDPRRDPTAHHLDGSFISSNPHHIVDYLRDLT